MFYDPQPSASDTWADAALLTPTIPYEDRDKPFRGTKTARSRDAHKFVQAVIAKLLAFEAETSPRQRKRKPADQRILAEQVEAVICEAVCQELTNQGQWLSVPFTKRVLGKKTRYSTGVMKESLAVLIRMLADPRLGMLKLEIGWHRFDVPSLSRQTRFTASDQLMELADSFGLDTSDFSRRMPDELVILKSCKEYHNDDADLIDYEDTPQTRKYRDDLRAINEWLQDADITCDDPSIDGSQRSLRRHFSNGSFDQCGRLYGAFWMEMSKASRFDSIRLDGQRLVELDYQSMIVRLLYAYERAEVPPGDPYQVVGLERCGREGVKKLFATLLFDSKPRTCYPTDGTIKPFFPRKMKVVEAIGHLKKHHSLVAHHFGTGIGLHLMFKESEIMVDLLLSAMRMNITVLPIHDALLVPQGMEKVMVSLMETTFLHHTGMRGVVNVG